MTPAALHTQTPTLTVIDPRQRAVRVVGYLRLDQQSPGLPDRPTPSGGSGLRPRKGARGAVAFSDDVRSGTAAGAIDACVTLTRYDETSRSQAHWDPRLAAKIHAGETQRPNTRVIATLSSAIVRDDSVDAGRKVSLNDTSGHPRHAWTQRAARRIDYDTLGRPTTIHERLGTAPERCAERLTYGDADAIAYRRCGRLIRHDDGAGTRLYDGYDLTAAVARDTRYFLSAASAPDWPEDITARTALLETDAFSTLRVQDALAEPCQQTDALGNVQRTVRNVAGQAVQHWLRLSTKAEQCVARDLTYDATAQLTARTLGNGATSQWTYDDADGRLRRTVTRHPDASLLQDLSYTYDPGRHVLSIADATMPTRYVAGKAVDALDTYRYDTLYRLVEATGMEQAGATNGPGLPAWQPLPPGTPIAYRRTYTYDKADNLLRLQHVGASAFERTMIVSPTSNRSLPSPDDGSADLDNAFDACGNLRWLQPGQSLSWTGLDELATASLVTRAGDPDDTETHAYNGEGERIRKRRSRRVSGRDVVDEIRYLPGLEIRSNGATGERLHVIQGQAEAAGVHALHWPGTPPDGLANDALRYSLTDHLNSCAMELDGNAASISLERYYPFGGTSFTATRHALEADYRTIRYAGKERDASGLYYYGSRYYAPWMHRWTQPDPAGMTDGLNRYVFVHDDPVNHIDSQGQVAVSLTGYITSSRQAMASGPLDASLAMLTDHPAMPDDADSFSEISTFVDAATFDRLDLADRAIHMTKTVLPYGSDNQMVDIVRTNSLNKERLKYRTENIHAGRDVLKVLTKQGAGRCLEHAQFTYALLARQSLDTPLMQVQAEGADHAFTLLGDPREVSPTRVVVADAWVSLPTAHLLSEGNFSFGKVVASLPPHTSFPELAIRSTWLTELPHDVGGTDRADQRLVQDWEKELPSLWNEQTSTTLIGSSYTDGSRRARYDVFPLHRLDEHLRLQDHVRSLRERMESLQG